MNQPLWKKLVELSRSDNAIQEETSKYTRLKEEIASKKSSQTLFEKTFFQAEETLKSLSKDIRTIEQKLEEITQIVQEKKARFEKLTSSREINAFKKELATLGLEHQDFENQLLSLWNQKENAEKKLELQKIEHKENQATMEEDLKKLEEQGKETLKAIEDLEAAQRNIELEIPQEWLIRYKKMKGKVTNPIVPVLPASTSCSVCFYHILPQDATRLKKNALINCRNCYRLLYHPEAVSAQELSS